MRLAPGDSSKQAMERLREHLEKHVPWGAQLTFTAGELGEPTQIDATGPAYDAARAAFRDAWDGVEPVDMGVGGSIPFIAAFNEAFPDAAVLVTGVEDPDTRAHGANEGLHLAEFERVCLAEALLLHNLAQRRAHPPRLVDAAAWTDSSGRGPGRRLGRCPLTRRPAAAQAGPVATECSPTSSTRTTPDRRTPAACSASGRRARTSRS